MSENLLQEFLYLKEGVGIVLNNINDINRKLDNLTNQLNLSRTVNLTTENEVKKFKTEISEYKSLLLELKAGYNSNQPRVPAGNSDGGQWSDSGSSAGRTRTVGLSRTSFGHEDSPYYDLRTGIYDPPIKPVYPIETVIGIGVGGKIVGAAIKPLATRTLRAAVSIRNYARFKTSGIAKETVTSHGSVRVGERNVTNKEVQRAIESSKKNGTVEEKHGKYGTLQKRYHGDNGLSVIIETEGRNAGKIITTYRRK